LARALSALAIGSLLTLIPATVQRAVAVDGDGELIIAKVGTSALGLALEDGVAPDDDYIQLRVPGAVATEDYLEQVRASGFVDLA
jgi:hypothetical protein